MFCVQVPFRLRCIARAFALARGGSRWRRAWRRISAASPAVRDSMGRRVGGSSGGRGRIGIGLWVAVVVCEDFVIGQRTVGARRCQAARRVVRRGGRRRAQSGYRAGGRSTARMRPSARDADVFASLSVGSEDRSINGDETQNENASRENARKRDGDAADRVDRRGGVRERTLFPVSRVAGTERAARRVLHRAFLPNRVWQTVRVSFYFRYYFRIIIKLTACFVQLLQVNLALPGRFTPRGVAVGRRVERGPTERRRVRRRVGVGVRGELDPRVAAAAGVRAPGSLRHAATAVAADPGSCRFIFRRASDGSHSSTASATADVDSHRWTGSIDGSAGGTDGADARLVPLPLGCGGSGSGGDESLGLDLRLMNGVWGTDVSGSSAVTCGPCASVRSG